MNRLLSCNSCDHLWTGSSELPDGPMHCPRCGAHVCACGCGANLDDQRSDARWKARSCYMSLQRSAGATTPSAKANVARTRGRVGGRGGNVADLDQARDLQAASVEKDRWTRIVREQITRTLVGTEAFHADDCDALGVPVEHCNLIGLEIAAFRNRGLMESTGVYRKVSHKAAKGRKAPVYRITSKGRRDLTVGVDVSRGPVGSLPPESTTVAGIHPGGQSAQVNTGAPTSKESGRATNPPVPSASDETGGSPESVTGPSGEPARLFDDSPPSAYDPWRDAA